MLEPMTIEKKNRMPERASFFALFAVIFVVSVLLALYSDLNIVMRGLVALSSGLAAAVVSHIVATRISGRRPAQP